MKIKSIVLALALYGSCAGVQAAPCSQTVVCSQPNMVNVLEAAKAAYAKDGSGEVGDVDWGVTPQQIKSTIYNGQDARVLRYEAFNPAIRAYDEVKVYVANDGAVLGATIKYLEQ